MGIGKQVVRGLSWYYLLRCTLGPPAVAPGAAGHRHRGRRHGRSVDAGSDSRSSGVPGSACDPGPGVSAPVTRVGG